MRRRYVVVGLCLAAFGCARPLVVKDPVRAGKWLEGRWRRIQKVRPTMSSRELLGFSLEAAAAGWHPERIAKALDLAEQMQDRDETSRTFGNFKWYWQSDAPHDRNAVEFSMQQGILAWMLYRDALGAEGAERLKRLIRFGVEGIRRHRVNVAYTNIYLMKIWNCIAIGEATGRPTLADQGYQMLDQWLLYTWESGVHEYLSPTYYGVDIESLALIARFAQRRSGRRKAKAALRLFYTDIAANWFEPCRRLGGAHSRDYDYVTGHGYLDATLRSVGWLADGRRPDASAFRQLSTWTPPARVRRSIGGAVPRMVRQRWGAAPWERAAHYVGHKFSIGSAGANYGPMDKVLTVNLAGGPKMPVVSFFMDARDDAYGKKRFKYGTDGHQKALHLQPFVTSVQRGGEVLLLASADPASRMFKIRAPEPTCLLSQLVIPAEVGIWLGDKAVEPAKNASVGVPDGAAVFLRFEDVAVGIRFVYATGTAGKPARVTLVNDGGKWDAMRLTCTHAAQAPTAPATVALWVRAAEGLDDAAFAAFRRDLSAAAVETTVEGGKVAIKVPCYGAYADSRVLPWLRLVADVSKRERLATEGEGPGAAEALLAVNGHDLGHEILDGLPPVAQYCRLLDATRRGARSALKAEQIIEAEAAALIIPPFQIDAGANASGGKFLWMPGEPDGKGGSSMARAMWLVHVPKAGDYTLWGRIQAPTPSDDSFWVRVRQNGREALPHTDWHTGVHKQWEWTRLVTGRDRQPRPIPLKAGVATVEFRCREDGTRLDALFLAADPTAQPPR